MAEYISKEDLIKAIEYAGADVIADYGDYDCESGFSRDNLSQIINSIPVADVAPVVRCKNCKYYVYGCCIMHSEEPDVFFLQDTVLIQNQMIFVVMGNERRTDQ